METKAAGASSNRMYEDFEPYCKWVTEEGHETLEIDLKGFKKDQLKVQTNTKGILAIYGERPVEASKHKWCRFRKEIKLSKDTDGDQINAKFSQNGILSVVMPKKVQPNSGKTDNEAKSIICGVKTRKRTAIKVAIGVVAVVVTLVALGTFISRVVNRHHHHGVANGDVVTV